MGIIGAGVAGQDGEKIALFRVNDPLHLSHLFPAKILLRKPVQQLAKEKAFMNCRADVGVSSGCQNLVTNRRCRVTPSVSPKLSALTLFAAELGFLDHA